MLRKFSKGTRETSPLLSNIYLHWFETCATLVAKGMNQVMSIVRYADGFVILARKLQGEFVRTSPRSASSATSSDTFTSTGRAKGAMF